MLSWDTLKEMKLQITLDSDSFEMFVNMNRYQYGDNNSYTTGYYVRKPRLEIQAIGRGVIEGTIGNLYSSKVNMNFITDNTATTFSAPATKPGIEITPLTISITPQFVDSIIEIKFNVAGEGDAGNGLVFNITRTVDGTETELNTDSNIYSGMSLTTWDNNYASTPEMLPIIWYDEPNTTSSVKYKIKCNATKSTAELHTFYYNRTKLDSTSSGGYERLISSSSVKELPQQTTLHNPRYNSVIEQEGQVLETLTGICDGRSISVSSGTYTLENVTAKQTIATTSYIKANGSVLLVINLHQVLDKLLYRMLLLLLLLHLV